MSFIMSSRMRSSFSPVSQSIASVGRPHLSFFDLVERHLVAVARQYFTERHAADLPRAGLCRAVLEVAADARLAHGPLPALAG